MFCPGSYSPSLSEMPKVSLFSSQSLLRTKNLYSEIEGLNSYLSCFTAAVLACVVYVVVSLVSGD